jgi:hypothetical protein
MLSVVAVKLIKAKDKALNERRRGAGLEWNTSASGL